MSPLRLLLALGQVAVALAGVGSSTAYGEPTRSPVTQEARPANTAIWLQPTFVFFNDFDPGDLGSPDNISLRYSVSGGVNARAGELPFVVATAFEHQLLGDEFSEFTVTDLLLRVGVPFTHFFGALGPANLFIFFEPSIQTIVSLRQASKSPGPPSVPSVTSAIGPALFGGARVDVGYLHVALALGGSLLVTSGPLEVDEITFGSAEGGALGWGLYPNVHIFRVGVTF